MSRATRCSPSTVHVIIKRWKNEATLEKCPKPGRPRKLTVKEIRYVLLSLKRDCRITNEALVNRLGGKISRTTIRRVF
ncbi:hypothetical protein DER44DRAFT_679494 [Fusarium oxysporum]|nr:hypothetical protein DER44DRAFT_679494 [Fusarium oxysporum]